MAAMTTALTEFSDNGNQRTSTVSGHTAAKPRLVIQKRTIPSSSTSSVSYEASVIYATEDSDGNILPGKVAFTASVRYPIQGDSTDLSAALVIFRDIVAGDEFEASVSSTGWL
jgi:hypothetical protein